MKLKKRRKAVFLFFLEPFTFLCGNSILLMKKIGKASRDRKPFSCTTANKEKRGERWEMKKVYINNQLFGEISSSGIIIDINGSKIGYYTGDKILAYSGILIGEVNNGYILDACGNKIGWIT